MPLPLLARPSAPDALDRGAVPAEDGERYDVVIVGAGSAGCVLAARLTEDDPTRRVLLLEAGEDDAKQDAITIPAAFVNQFRTRFDWAYWTEQQKHVSGRRLYWPRGKSLGGSSSMNAMIYIRGSRHDYDGWAEHTGDPRWSYEQVLPFFRRSEDNSRGESRFHGTGGPLRVEDPRSPHPWTARFVDGCVQVGHRRNDDFNGAEQDGAGHFQVTQKRGARWSTSTGFLRPVLDRPGLVVRTQALTHRVVVRGGRATGVEYSHAGRTVTAHAGEVLLCAGAIGSPQLLLLSGIGEPGHLSEVGVEVTHGLPGVGCGLQDHPAVPAMWTTTEEISLKDALTPKQMLDYYSRRRGMLTSNVGEGGLFFRSRPDLDDVDVQMHFAPVKFWDQAVADPDAHAATIGVTLVDIHSRGELRLRSADPRWSPAIDAGYLSDERDLDALVAGVGVAREIAASAAFRPVVRDEWFPGAAVTGVEALRDAVRHSMQTLYHPTSTCRMGSDDDAVVDSELRVHGIDGLRVADASVMPSVVRGNTNAPTIMIAERAADLLRGSAPARVVAATA